MSAPTPSSATKPDLSVDLAGLALAHPLLNASGTFDALEARARFGAAALEPFPFSAYVPKTVTLEPRQGNPPPRVTETAAGMINAVGLQNPGLDAWLAGLGALADVPVPVIVNVGGSRPEDYLEVMRRVEERLAAGVASGERLPDVVGYELNVSCPNVGRGGLAIGTEPAETERLTAAARALTGRLLIVKLTPNVTDVVAVARAAAGAGADALSLINTLKALVLDGDTLRPFLGNQTGGLCGPAIKPVALRMVWEIAGALDVPLIGMGGIASGRDVLEFVACGATAVAAGAVNFTATDAPRRIVDELRDELAARGLPRLADVRGRALG
ncbi:MAG TPA: dihydroorotate dehydrogenase [Thermoleophilia bacterium]|nr:dihydroorotate dehydrogenase [Thermoleophilia bacterium]